MERHGHLELPSDVRERLLSISPATVDRLLAPIRQAERLRGRSTTRSGSLLKHQVRVRTFADWDDVRPGFIEADLVAHCGHSTAGSYLHTLVLTDVATGWTEPLALLYRDQETVLHALRVGQDRLPIQLLGLDTDNGSEFLNYMLLAYCEGQQITFTRSRAYKKNDQCHVEQKNGTVVRRFVGYDRYEGLEACRVLSALYQTLRLYVNYFQPSMKLLSKEREGSKVVKHYDEAKTPCQRLLAQVDVPAPTKEALHQEYFKLDPVGLLAKIDGLQDKLWPLAYQPAHGVSPNGPVDTGEEVSSTTRVITGETTVVGESPLIRGDGTTEGLPVLEGLLKSRSERMYRRKKRKGRYHLVKRTWRTRKDPFEDVREELHRELRRRPHVAAKTLFLELQQRYPGKFQDGQLRTLQRRVKEWRLQQSTFVAEEIGQLIDNPTNKGHHPQGKKI